MNCNTKEFGFKKKTFIGSRCAENVAFDLFALECMGVSYLIVLPEPDF